MRIDFLWNKYSSLFLDGIQNALLSALLSMIVSLFLGVLVGTLSYSGKKVIKRVIKIYINLIRNTPLLVQIYFFFFGLPSLGINLTPFATGIIALSLNSGAYISEIIKSGLQAIEKGQTEAATSIGLTIFQKFKFILIPQAIPQIIPALAGQIVILFQDTSLLSVISVVEIVKTSQNVGNETYLFVDAYMIGCIIYFIILVCLNFFSDSIEYYFKNKNLRSRRRKSLCK